MESEGVKMMMPGCTVVTQGSTQEDPLVGKEASGGWRDWGTSQLEFIYDYFICTSDPKLVYLKTPTIIFLFNGQETEERET